MKLQLVLFDMLNPKSQILQSQGGNWGLVSRRRIGRGELSEERSSLYVESQRECCMLSAANPSAAMRLAKQGKRGFDQLLPQLSCRPPCPCEQSSSTIVRRTSAEAQSPSEKLGKHSGTKSMLNYHLSWLYCFQGPRQPA